MRLASSYSGRRAGRAARRRDAVARGRGRPAPIARYNVVWNSPSADASGVMPLGNGDVAAGVYALQDGDLYLLCRKTTPTPTWATSSRPAGCGSR